LCPDRRVDPVRADERVTPLLASVGEAHDHARTVLNEAATFCSQPHCPFREGGQQRPLQIRPVDGEVRLPEPYPQFVRRDLEDHLATPRADLTADLGHARCADRVVDAKSLQRLYRVVPQGDAAPISRISPDRSNATGSTPTCRRAIAAASPPIPAPMISAFATTHLHLWSRTDRQA